MDIDYGPLAGLIGTWTGSKGLDIAPEPDGTEIDDESGRLSYDQTTLLDIYGRRFDHTNKSVLTET